MEKRARVTLKTVARLAGCSPGATSVVLNNARGNIGVSPTTRKRVLEAARKLNYKPHFAARSLAKRSTRTLGLYLTPHPWGSIGSSYEGQIVRGIEQVAQERGYDLLLINMAARQPFDTCLRKIEESRIDGLILIHLDEMPEPDRRRGIQQLLERTSRVVAIDHAYLEPGLDSIIFDNPAAIRLAVEHLARLGHRRIGFLGGCLASPMPHAHIREQAFEQAMADTGLALDPAWIHNTRNCVRAIRREDRYCTLEGEAGAEHLWRLPVERRPTAMIAYNDLVAGAAMRWLGRQGVVMPERMSVMGVDDNVDLCELVTPRLTSLSHPLTEMGRAGALRLIARHEAWLAEEIVDSDSDSDSDAPEVGLDDAGTAEGAAPLVVGGGGAAEADLQASSGAAIWFKPELAMRDSTARAPRDERM